MDGGDRALLKARLAGGAARMGIDLSPVQLEQFAEYHALLTAANARMNLTRVPDDPAEAVDRNYLDCLAPVPDFGDDVRAAVDVGSGAGFPGVPMAIARGDIHFVLIDSLDKRVQFLQGVIDALGLNAEAVHLRAEEAGHQDHLRERFDLAAARAVAPLPVLAEYLLPLVRVGGRMLAMKGPGLDAELATAQPALEILGSDEGRAVALDIPGRDWDHRAAWIVKRRPTPDRYPRRAGLPAKKPLG